MLLALNSFLAINGFVPLEFSLYVFCIHFPKLICHKKYKDRLNYNIVLVVELRGITFILILLQCFEIYGNTQMRCDIFSLKSLSITTPTYFIHCFHSNK